MKNCEKRRLMEQMIHKVGHTTNHNNQFNINMFLNETCKNAINLSDFIDRIEISHDDLENNAQLGFVNGMTKILMDNLRQLTLQERPIHCTDVKRETFISKMKTCGIRHIPMRNWKMLYKKFPAKA